MDVDKRINELGDGSGTLDYDSVIQLASEVLDAAVAATLFRERDGMRKAISSTFGTEVNAAAAFSYMDAEIIRKGITV